MRTATAAAPMPMPTFAPVDKPSLSVVVAAVGELVADAAGEGNNDVGEGPGVSIVRVSDVREAVDVVGVATAASTNGGSVVSAPRA